MPILNPNPNTLGIFSPQIGPWFDQAAVTLAVPDANLAVPLAPLANIWLPPAAGTLSFFVATNPRPPQLASLRDPAGNVPAFTNGRLIALFRLLPEVEQRLHALSAAIPSIPGAPALATVPARPRVRYFALEFPANYTFPQLVAIMPAGFSFPQGMLAVDQPTHLGLTWVGGVLGNATRPMSDMARPGQFLNTTQQLLDFTNNPANVRLFCFDSRGRPLDPGAVACWWNFLATDVPVGFGGPGGALLWAPNVANRTAPVAAGQLTIHLVNAHEGPLDAQPPARAPPTTSPAFAATTNLFTPNPGAGAGTIAFNAAPTPDDLPTPRAAVLPDGTYAATSPGLWPAGALNALLNRDFARVAVLSVEHQIVGQRREYTVPVPANPTAADTIALARAAAQDDLATSIRIGRVATPALLDNHELVLGALSGALGVAGPAELVTSTLERDFGPLPALPALPTPPAAAWPATIPAPTMTNLVGTQQATTIIGQRALFSLNLGVALAGAWVRVWTQGFDAAKGERYHLDGGSGTVQADGTLDVVIGLQDGVDSPAALIGVDLLIVAANNSRLYGDIRFPRPTVDGAALVPLNTITNNTALVVCETGATLTAAPQPNGTMLANGTIPSGANLIAKGPPRLIDPATIPAAVLSATAVINRLTPGRTVELTQPAFPRVPTGDTAALLSAGGAAVNRRTRTTLDGWQAGYPIPGMERLELALGHVTGGVAVVGSVPGLARYHEVLPHLQGHPQTPAAVEIHGTGVNLAGPGALGTWEYTRDRTAGDTVNLAMTAFGQNYMGAAGARPAAGLTAWPAGLRTVAAGVEAEIGFPQILDYLSGQNPHTFTNDWANMRAWWAANAPGGTPPLPVNPAGDMLRALDRRMCVSAKGGREGATSLVAAINRAEDFIYIETPALDDRAFGPANDTINLLQTIIARMTARPALQLILCVPRYLLPGTPSPLQRVRDSLVIAASTAISNVQVRADRFVRFSPSAGVGRSLRIASTTVIVDDAYALTGTTHLWRRGLCFDSSFAVALFDEVLDIFGRPADISRFRRLLVAGRLGLTLGDVPEDPAELVQAIKMMQDRGGFGKFAVSTIPPPDPTQNTTTLNNLITDEDAWNPDGSPRVGFDVASLFAGLMTANTLDEEFSKPQP